MTTAAEERNGASDVTRARENPPSRKPAEHYWGYTGFSSFILLPSPQGSEFGFHNKLPEYNSPPAPPSGWSGSTLDKPWTCPGTIEPPQTPVFDQPSLFRPLSCGLSAAEGFTRGADPRSEAARGLRLCEPVALNSNFGWLC